LRRCDAADVKPGRRISRTILAQPLLADQSGRRTSREQGIAYLRTGALDPHPGRRSLTGFFVAV